MTAHAWTTPTLSSGLGAMVTTDEYTFKDCQTTLFGNPSFTTIKYHEKGQGQLRRRYDIQAYSQEVAQDGGSYHVSNDGNVEREGMVGGPIAKAAKTQSVAMGVSGFRRFPG